MLLMHSKHKEIGEMAVQASELSGVCFIPVYKIKLFRQQESDAVICIQVRYNRWSAYPYVAHS